jgi:hypothetical protein
MRDLSNLGMLFLSSDHNLSYPYLTVHPDQMMKIKQAWAVTLLILPASNSMEARLEKEILLWCLLKKTFCAKMFVFMWQKVDIYVYRIRLHCSCCQAPSFLFSITYIQNQNCFPWKGTVFLHQKRENQFLILPNQGRAFSKWKINGCLSWDIDSIVCSIETVLRADFQVAPKERVITTA